MTSYFIGVDVGGTTSTIAIGDSGRRLRYVSNQFPTPAADGPHATLHDIVRQIDQALQGLSISPDQVASVAIATPGPATKDGVLRGTPNLRADLWSGFPIRQALQEQLNRSMPGLNVRYIGDGQAAALGEYAIRSGRFDDTHCVNFALDSRVAKHANLSSIFFVAVGTGLGGGEVRDGKVVQGAEGRAGHAGHLLLPEHAFRYDHDRTLRVGNSFCTAESAISLTALTHQLAYRLTLEKYCDHPLNLHPGSMKDRAKTLRQYVADGDELALELLDDQARALGIVLLMINYIGDYDLLVIGGGVCDMTDSMRERYLKNAERSYYEYALDGFRNLSSLAFSICGDSASVIGALSFATDTQPP